MAKHPMQPIEYDEVGVVRFKSNAIIARLWADGVIDLNALARMDFTDEDRMQLAQLLGYSVSGFGDLPYAKKKIVRKADRIAAALTAIGDDFS